MKFSIFEIFGFHDTTRCCKSQPSFQIRFAIWHHGSKGKDEKTCRKIRLGQTNSQISRNSRLNTPKILNPFSPRMRPITPVPVLLFGLPLYESCWWGSGVAARAPGRAGKIYLSPRRRSVRPNCSIFGLPRKFGFCAEIFEISGHGTQGLA